MKICIVKTANESYILKDYGLTTSCIYGTLIERGKSDLVFDDNANKDLRLCEFHIPLYKIEYYVFSQISALNINTNKGMIFLPGFSNTTLTGTEMTKYNCFMYDKF